MNYFGNVRLRMSLRSIGLYIKVFSSAASSSLPVLSLYAISTIRSFIMAISIAPLQSSTIQRRSRHSTDTVSEFHAEAPQATVSE